MNLEINNTIKNIHRGGSGNEEHEPQLRQPPEAGLRYTGVIYTPAGVMGSNEMNVWTQKHSSQHEGTQEK